MSLKKFCCFLAAAMMLLGPVSAVQAQPLLQTTAESAILMDASTGKVLFEKEPDKELPPASVTKVLTLLVALDAIEQGKVKLDDKVTASENASKMGGSQIYLEPGETMSLKTMLISIAVGSANDCCVAVAEHIAGSHEAYVKMMNDKAKSIGCKHTKFVNAYGLPADGHYTSARDLAIMMREVLKYPLFNEITRIKRYDLRNGKFVLHNTNKLLWWYRGAEGGKTGWTSEAKYCLASSAQRDKLKLIAVVMATPETRSHFRESMKLYNFGFAQYEAVPIAKGGQVLGKVRVSKGTVEWTEAVPRRDISAVVNKGKKADITYKISLNKLVQAPAKKGTTLGTVTVFEDKKEILREDLVSRKELQKGTVFRQIFKLIQQVYSYNS